MSRLRVVSYNVRGLRDDGDAVARILRAAEPDVVAIQEAPGGWRWRPRAAALARRVGLVVLGGGRPAGYNLLLCAVRVHVHGTRDLLLSQCGQLPPRGAAMALCSVGDMRFGLVGTHLDLDAAARCVHAKELLDATGWMGQVPLVVAGDVNESPGEPAWAALTERLTDVVAAGGAGDAPTYSATRPRRRIDAVFADPSVRVLDARVLDEPDVAVASDHRPVLVDLELP